MIISTALMIWKGLMVVTGSESPIVVVLRFVFSSLEERDVVRSSLVEVWNPLSSVVISFS